jgi:hypothetical protein
VIRVAEDPHFAFAFVVAVVCFLFSSKRVVISTEAAHALREQRSGEIRFSTKALHSLDAPIAVVLCCCRWDQSRASARV